MDEGKLLMLCCMFLYYALGVVTFVLAFIFNYNLYVDLSKNTATLAYSIRGRAG